MLLAQLALMLQPAGAAASPPAGDVVVHFEIVAGRGASSGDRSTLYRSGNLSHTEATLYGDARSSSYLDRASGLEVTARRDRDGMLLEVTIAPPFSRPQRRFETGRRDRALGEDCRIWRVITENGGSRMEICETVDGVPLREAFWYPTPDDRTVLYRRATAIERRPVRPEELLPPRDLLALAFAPATAVREGGAVPDHEVEMVGRNRADGHYVSRRHGPYSSIDRRTPEGRTLWIDNGAVSVRYVEDETGRPISLEIARSSEEPFQQIVPRWVRLPGRAPVRLLGESCTWQENAAIESSDRHYHCRTANGIVLMTESTFHFTSRTERFTARRLSRRPRNPAEFAPPARILDWAYWGITPAP